MPANPSRDLARYLGALDDRIKDLEAGARTGQLQNASITGAAITFYDEDGATRRGAIGLQPDGTIGLIAANGPAPAAPTPPTVTPSLAGLRVTWDGLFADGSATPADFDHVAVHVSTTDAFTPSAATFVGTITRAGDGGMLPVAPLPYELHYVRLVGVNSSGIPGDPSAQATGTPLKVDGPDLTAGSVTAGVIAAGAVTADKLEAILQLATRIVAGDPDAARVEINADGLRVYDADNILRIQFDSATGDAVFTGTITGSEVNGGTLTGSFFQTAASGERITLNEEDANMILVYNGVTASAIGELSPRGLIVESDSGAYFWLDPNAPYPTFWLANAGHTNSAVINISETTAGAADLGMNSGTFEGSGFTDMKWRNFFGNDFYVAERVRDSNVATYLGGRLFLTSTDASLAYRDATDPTQDAALTLQTGLATLSNARLAMTPPASSSAGLSVSAAAGHTGNLVLVQKGGSDRFAVDADGVMTAKNIANGTVTITPSAANVPTSALVSYNIAGAVVRGYATANTTVPGTRAAVGSAGVTGVSVSSATNTSMLVWVNRENTTNTIVNWEAKGLPT